jgi:hypothetical protein
VETIFFHANKEIWRKTEEKVEPLKARLSPSKKEQFSVVTSGTDAFFDPYGTPVEL